MGTRSITEVKSGWNGGAQETNAIIYRHWDGYLSGHGEWLYNFLKDLEVINGIPGNPPPRYANGPGRLAAMMVSELQNDGHNPDLLPDGTDCGQEYHYLVSVNFGRDGGMVTVTVFDGPMTFFGHGGEKCKNQIFDGTVEQFGKFLAEDTQKAG